MLASLVTKWSTRECFPVLSLIFYQFTRRCHRSSEAAFILSTPNDAMSSMKVGLIDDSFQPSRRPASDYKRGLTHAPPVYHSPCLFLFSLRCIIRCLQVTILTLNRRKLHAPPCPSYRVRCCRFCALLAAVHSARTFALLVLLIFTSSFSSHLTSDDMI